MAEAGDISGNDALINADDTLLFTEGRDGGQAMVLTKDNGISIDRGENFLFGRDAFGFSLDLYADADGAGGKVFRLVNSMRLTATNGDLEFVLNNADGDRFRVARAGGVLDGSDWHRVEVGYDSAAENLWLSIDGTRVDETTARGDK